MHVYYIAIYSLLDLILNPYPNPKFNPNPNPNFASRFDFRRDSITNTLFSLNCNIVILKGFNFYYFYVPKSIYMSTYLSLSVHLSFYLLSSIGLIIPLSPSSLSGKKPCFQVRHKLLRGRNPSRSYIEGEKL